MLARVPQYCAAAPFFCLAGRLPAGEGSRAPSKPPHPRPLGSPCCTDDQASCKQSGEACAVKVYDVTQVGSHRRHDTPLAQHHLCSGPGSSAAKDMFLPCCGPTTMLAAHHLITNTLACFQTSDNPHLSLARLLPWLPRSPVPRSSSVSYSLTTFLSPARLPPRLPHSSPASSWAS